MRTTAPSWRDRRRMPPVPLCVVIAVAAVCVVNAGLMVFAIVEVLWP